MVRKALLKDIKQIHNLINFFAKDDLMLPRAISDLYDGIRDFFVYEENGTLLGCCALHISWEDLAEIRSLAVNAGCQHKGIGGKLVNACLKEAGQFGIKKVFVLTYIPDYFEKFAFARVKKSSLPRKVWGECISCVKFPDCSEIPMIKEL